MTAFDSDLEYLSDDDTFFSTASDARKATLQRCLDQPFSGEIIVNHADRTRTANGEYTVLDLTNRLVFWTDASVLSEKQGKRTGIAIVWKPLHYVDEWASQTYALEHVRDSNEGEFFAIAEALRLATKLCRCASRDQRSQDVFQTEDSVSSVAVYSDSTAALQCIRDFHARQQTRIKFGRHVELAKLKERAQTLTNLGIQLRLIWVKGHKGVEGNMIADRLAHKAAQLDAAVDLMVPSMVAYIDVDTTAKAKTSVQDKQTRKQIQKEKRKRLRRAKHETIRRRLRQSQEHVVIVISDSEEDTSAGERGALRLRSGRRISQSGDSSLPGCQAST